MILQNKKTGEIISKIDVSQDLEGIWVLENNPRFYRTLAELNEEWEDYKPQEPLIKDEKIRKAVRAWAEALDIDEVYINYIGDNTYIELYEDPEKTGGWNRMSLPDQNGIKKNERYAITELCGEEEE